MIQQSVEVLWNKKLRSAYYKIALTCSDHYSWAKPGQFVMLGVAGRKQVLTAEELRPLAMQINRLRDKIDEELFGHQDYGLVGTKPAVADA